MAKLVLSILAALRPMLLPLLPARVRPYAKTAAVVAGLIVTALVAHYQGNDILTGISSVLTALGVYAQPNGEADQGA